MGWRPLHSLKGNGGGMATSPFYLTGNVYYIYYIYCNYSDGMATIPFYLKEDSDGMATI